MDSFGEWILGFLGDLLKGVIDFLGKWLMQTWMVPFINTFKDFGDKLFTNFMDAALLVLVKSPDEWNPTGWAFIVSNVNTVFVALGSQLVVLFFLIGFFAESVDPKSEIRIQTLMKALFKILFAQYLVCNSVNIITTTFGIVGKVITKIGLTEIKSPSWNIYAGNKPIDFDATLEAMDGTYFVLTLLVAFIYMVVMIGAGAMIAYTAYIRFFRIMVIVPYGALASSTVAGNNALNHTAMQFYKYVLSVVFEAATMIIAIGLYVNIGDTFQLLVAETQNDYILYEFINRLIATLLLVGAVKGAGAITQRALGQ